MVIIRGWGGGGGGEFESARGLEGSKDLRVPGI